MKAYLFLFSLFAVFQAAFSQELTFKAPNYKEIKKNIEDKSSTYYYPKLIERFKANDSLINKEEYLHLYYGYVFDSKFSAFFRSSDEKLNKFYKSDTIDPKDYKEIIKLSENSLNSFPFDLRIINFLAYIYHLKGEEATSKSWSTKYENIMETIMSTGDGKTCETGFHVISVSHEYALINTFQLEVASQSLINNCDYLAFEKGKYKIDGIYFSIGKILESESKMFGGK
ncbi:DUF4919 domain-containing protein [Flavobacterium sp. SUN046]|uniref:DUF4919 domain-containing protein n=1 Tax=Flavobacterium sp. SUN046 TaxID=3002440 RepID=UPI002DB86F44|nr:DUF4919 domain-containing protein [Flavobacterium sp. SUN046]MEC4048354.1 DUF4919 domain-containing protein [Flavobacterium sp. SUN046]